MQLGDAVTITHVYRRRTQYRPSVANPRYDLRMKVWEAQAITPRQAIFLGWRTLCNGSSEWEDEVGYVFDPDKGGHFQAALVCFSTRENPVYVPVERLQGETQP